MNSASPVLCFYSCAVATSSPALWATPWVPWNSSGALHPPSHCSHCWPVPHGHCPAQSGWNLPALCWRPTVYPFCFPPWGFSTNAYGNPLGSVGESTPTGLRLNTEGWELSHCFLLCPRQIVHNTFHEAPRRVLRVKPYKHLVWFPLLSTLTLLPLISVPWGHYNSVANSNNNNNNKIIIHINIFLDS